MKKNYPTSELMPLPEADRKILANAVLGYGNMAKVVAKTGISDVTIRRAILGVRVSPPVHSTLRAFCSTFCAVDNPQKQKQPA